MRLWSVVVAVASVRATVLARHGSPGAVQRGGNIRLERIPDIKKDTLHGFIQRTVKDAAEAIYTDELRSYMGIADHDTRHETVRHSEEEWVAGDVHTNSIEGVWSLFKRSIVGTFHKMSVKHMDRYLEELEWRFNNRDNPAHLPRHPPAHRGHGHTHLRCTDRVESWLVRDSGLGENYYRHIVHHVRFSERTINTFTI